MKQQRTEATARAQRGFTLIELMIAVAVVGILIGIAVPTYQDSVRKSRRAQAKADLTEVAQAMERYYTVNNSYAGASMATIWGNPAQSPRGSDSPRYNLSFQAAPGSNGFVVQAVPISGTGQERDKCGTMTLSNTGTKTPNTAGTKDCWNLN
ncbi:type IV pilin protein [Lysobacter enzymogenes]|uniref:type IV pilin protein n=1 Tax=Lysobacter enzymogenes TaxID=69 RepID=UPI001A96E2E0|nr:type IV pilin protein [Lysobacter enzymogenes]QQP98066.1 type IV pilin protein [Lysobacter enzymogenes]